MTEIILIKFRNREYEDPCLYSLIANTNAKYHLTVYDNSVHNENIGKLWNRLIERSDAKYICLLNTDTLVTNGWLTKLLGVFKEYDNVGCVGPSTTSSSNPQECVPAKEKKVIDYRETYPMGTLTGFCLLFPKKVWKAVGGFPEDFGFYGQEDDFLDKISFAGYKQLWRQDAFVLHYGAATAKKVGLNIEVDIAAARKLRDDKRSERRKCK